MFGLFKKKDPEEEEQKVMLERLKDARFEEEEGVPCLVTKTLEFFNTEFDKFEYLPAPQGTRFIDYDVSMAHKEKQIEIHLSPIKFNWYTDVYLHSYISVRNAIFKINHDSAWKFKAIIESKTQEKWDREAEERERHKKDVLTNMGCL
jgi:hypothetical protein